VNRPAVFFIVFCLLFVILSGCGKNSGNSTIYSYPTEKEATEYVDFFVKAINAGEYEKIDETIDPGAALMFSKDLTAKMNAKQKKEYLQSIFQMAEMQKNSLRKGSARSSPVPQMRNILVEVILVETKESAVFRLISHSRAVRKSPLRCSCSTKMTRAKRESILWLLCPGNNR